MALRVNVNVWRCSSGFLWLGWKGRKDWDDWCWRLPNYLIKVGCKVLMTCWVRYIQRICEVSIQVVDRKDRMQLVDNLPLSIITWFRYAWAACRDCSARWIEWTRFSDSDEVDSVLLFSFLLRKGKSRWGNLLQALYRARIQSISFWRDSQRNVNSSPFLSPFPLIECSGEQCWVEKEFLLQERTKNVLSLCMTYFSQYVYQSLASRGVLLLLRNGGQAQYSKD